MKIPPYGGIFIDFRC